MYRSWGSRLTVRDEKWLKPKWIRTSSGEQRCVSFSSLFCCGHCGSCGFHCHHGGRGHFCYGCVDARESSFLSLIHFTIRRNRENFDLRILTRPIAISRLLRAISDRRTDGRTDRPTDKAAYRVACTRLKTRVLTQLMGPGGYSHEGTWVPTTLCGVPTQVSNMNIPSWYQCEMTMADGNQG